MTLGFYVQREGVGISPEVGYRLAGVIDGEGHFGISRPRKPSGTVTYMPFFAMNMRDDDRAFLERLQHESGLGKLYGSPAQFRNGFHSKPLTSWRIHAKAETIALVAILEQYPLWSKKQRDFAIWAKAVRYQHGPWPEGNAPLARYSDEIRAIRKYEDRELEYAVVESDALRLFEHVTLAARFGEESKATEGTL